MNFDDDLTWRPQQGFSNGVSLSSRQDYLILKGPVRLFNPGTSPFSWESEPNKNTATTFHTAVEITGRRLPRGDRSFTLKAPWWWIVLIFAILPAGGLRSGIRSAGIKFGIAARGAIAAALVLMIVLNVAPDLIRHPDPKVMSFSARRSKDFQYGWPFLSRILEPVDDGTNWSHWDVNGVASNLMVALAFSFAAAVPVQILVYMIKRLRRRWLAKPGHCKSCGYNLTGNVSGLCPECGTNASMSAVGK